MTYAEMNSFILDYIKNDISGRAIMLSGPWGSGKSYYIKNTLKPFLESKEGGKHKCAIVSLYGLTSTSDISKAIYMELRSIKKETESEAGSTAKVVSKIVAKTIANGLASRIGFDIGNVSDEDLQKVYDSLDLTGKLVVLEDIERTKIDLFALLGFINNICEHDRVKVLLVTNESEIMELEEKKDENGKSIKRYTDATVAYLRAKEKTIGDTIHFSCDYINTILQIIDSFGIYLKKYHTLEYAADIRDIFAIMQSANLRAFIFACQKSRNIFEYIHLKDIHLSEEIEKIIFYGIIGFTQGRSRGETARFDSNSYISAKHGVSEAIPLFLFCYDYIVFQTLSEEEIQKASTYYSDYLHKGKWNSGRDADLKVIRDYYIKPEKEVRKALANLPGKISAGAIPYHDYGVLINYMAAIRYDADIDFDTDAILSPILDYLQKLDETIEIESLFSSGTELFSDEAKSAFTAMKLKMKEALNKRSIIAFSYNPADIKKYCADRPKELSDDGFAHNIDQNQFIEMLRKCDALQISQLRSLFMDLYRNQSYTRTIEQDLPALVVLRDGIVGLLVVEEYDKTKLLQIRWFSKNLSEIIDSFEKQKTAATHTGTVVVN